MIRLDFRTQAVRKRDAAPALNLVADRCCEVLPSVIAWKGSEDETYRLYLDSRLAELEHAARLAREAL